MDDRQTDVTDGQTDRQAGITPVRVGIWVASVESEWAGACHNTENIRMAKATLTTLLSNAYDAYLP